MANRCGNLWARLTASLTRRRGEANKAPELPRVGDDGLLSEPVELEYEPEPSGDKGARPLSRWSKRDQTLAKLQEGYEQVTQLIEQISKHLVAQGQASERICTSLEQLAKSMGDVPAISRQQAQTLEQIAAQIEAAGARTERLAEGMADLPRLARSQGETLTGINRQLEMANEQTVVTSQTMDKLGHAIHLLGQANQAQAEVLKQMDAQASEQNEVLRQLISRQGRRFIALFVVTTILAAAAITLGILALVLRTV